MDYTGRIAKWGTVLGASDIKYMSRTSVKGQVLANLVAEFAEPPLEEVAATQSDSRGLCDGASSGNHHKRVEIYIVNLVFSVVRSTKKKGGAHCINEITPLLSKA